MADASRSSRVLRFLNPFSRFEAGPSPGRRLEEAIEACRRADPAAAVEGLDWFGWEPADAPGGRYVLAGFTPDPAIGVERGCGYLVDVVSGHVLWACAIGSRRELPLTMSGVMSAQNPPIH
jgi:hypothetical protein